MEAILKRNRIMSADDLARLTVRELRKLSRLNYLLFHGLSILNLVVFYHSLHVENWLLLFVSLGFFIVSLSVYDNYRTSCSYLDKANRRERFHL